MSYHYGQATDYLDLLLDFIDFCTQESITAVAVNNGGTGYAVDDILSVAGGTGRLVATIRVTAVSAGVITAVQVEAAGSYTARPTMTGNAVTGGSGSGATMDLTITTLLVKVVVNSGGSSYVVGDILTVAGGTGTAATIEVTSVAAGVIDGVKVLTTGAYTANPSTTANAVTGGSGSSATMDLTLATNGWNTQLNQVYATTERETIFQGIGSGPDQIYVGIRTYRDAGPDIFNWELAGFTGYQSAAAWSAQPGISPGRHDAASVEDGGAFMPLDDSTINFWFNVDGRRMIFVLSPTAGSGYHQGYLGYYDSFATQLELPYPIIVCGSAPHRSTRFNSTRAGIGGLSFPAGKSRNSGFYNGGMMFRFSDGVWYTVANRLEIYNSGNESTSDGRTVALANMTPPALTHAGVPSTTDPNKGVLENAFTVHWLSIVPIGGTAELYSMRDTPNTPNFDVALFTGIILTSDAHGQIPKQIIGVLNDVKWCPVGGTSVGNQDLVTDGGDVYIVFQNGNRTGNNDFTAIRIN